MERPWVTHGYNTVPLLESVVGGIDVLRELAVPAPKQRSRLYKITPYCVRHSEHGAPTPFAIRVRQRREWQLIRVPRDVIVCSLLD